MIPMIFSSSIAKTNCSSAPPVVSGDWLYSWHKKPSQTWHSMVLGWDGVGRVCGMVFGMALGIDLGSFVLFIETSS